MPNRFIFILFLSLLIGEQSIGQAFFYEKATIINFKGDTLLGWVERLSERQMSLGVNFKSTKESEEAIQYSPREIKTFSFESDKVTFESVEYSKKKAEGELATVNRFAKKLLTAYCNLYKLYPLDGEYDQILKDGAYYIYIVLKEGKYYKLEETEKYIDDPSSSFPEASKYKVDKKYLGQLSYLTFDCKKNIGNLNFIPFKDQYIIKYLKKYNNCVAPDIPNIELNYKIKSENSLNLKAGYSLTSNEFVTTNYGFGIGVHFVTFQATLNKNRGLKAGLEYHFHDLQSGNDIEVNRHLIKMPISAIFLFKTSKSSNIFMDIGLNINFDLSKTEDAAASVLKSGPSFFVHEFIGLGFNFNKWDIYSLFQGDFFDLKNSDKFFEIGLAYRFLSLKNE